MWFGPFRPLQKLFFHTPLVNVFIWGSAIYHDSFWWPMNGTKVLREWGKTPWGQLFNTYKE
jgi:hypothetical protein